MSDNTPHLSRTPVVEGLRGLTFSHPRLRWMARETWGLVRRTAERLHLPAPFEPTEWSDLRAVRESAHPVAPGAAPRVLFLSFRGWSTAILWETTIAHALRLRGAEPVFATCGGRLPICDVTTSHAAPPMPCLSCGHYAESALAAAGFSAHTVRALVDISRETAAARERVHALRTADECEAFVDGDLPLGKLVRISVAWFMARGTLPDTEQVRATYRRFLVSGQVLHRAFAQLLDEVAPQRIFLINGAFFAERILAELAERRGIPVTSYERGFLADTLVVTQRPTCDLEIEDEFWNAARPVALTDSENDRLDNYLGGRTRGEGQTDDFWKNRVEDWQLICTQLDLDPARPKVALFTNVIWDSAVQGRHLAFESMGEWVLDVIRGFAARPGYDLVIRLHPAELSGNHKTEERMADVISEAFPVLPANVRVIDPTSPTSSYSLMAEAQVGLVYASTVGLEMALNGTPVVVSALTHYRGKGFTFDAGDPTEFWRMVDDVLVNGVSPETSNRHRLLARRYANTFFFRFMQRFPLVKEEVQGRPKLTYSSVDALRPGADAGLDRIAAAVIDGTQILAL